MRSIASIIQISTEVLEMIEDRDEAFAGWTLELEKREDTKTPQLGQKVILAHGLYAQLKATQKLIDIILALLKEEAQLKTSLSDILYKYVIREEDIELI